MKDKKRILIFALTASLITLSAAPAFAGHWADEKYDYIKAAGILNSDFGTAPEVQKDQNITRGEFFSLVVCMLYGKQAPVSDEADFKDFSKVPQSLSGYLSKAYKEKILTGIQKDGLSYIDVEKPISRQDAAIVLGRALGLSMELSSGFTDDNGIGEYAKDYVIGCERSGLIAGYPDGRFYPEGNLTWAESISIVSTAAEGWLANPPEVTTAAGNGGRGTGNGSALASSFNNPSSITVWGDTLYIADSGNNKIRALKGGTVSDYAGRIIGYDLYNNAVNGFKDALLKEALFANPEDMTAGDRGLFVADSQNNSIRLVADNKVYTYAGGQESGYRDGKKTEARFNNPKGICLDEAGNLYIADTGNSVIRKIDGEGNVTTIAGQAGKEGYQDGAAASAMFNYPTKLIYASGTLYVSDSANNRVRAVRDGQVTTLAGSGTDTYEGTGDFMGDYRDGAALKSAFSNPTGLCAGDDGTIYVADTGNSRVRAIKDGKIFTLSKLFVNPTGLCIYQNELYVTDSFRNTVTAIALTK